MERQSLLSPEHIQRPLLLTQRHFAVSSPFINIMARAAMRAAKGLLRDFGEVENLQVSRKGPGNFVSNADRNAEAMIFEELRRAYPHFGFVMEEGGVRKGEDEHFVWVVDPLDGTTNFLHALPHFAISIALQKSGDFLAGVIFDPVNDELFWAEQGMGAFLWDRRLRVATRRNLEESLLGTYVPVGIKNEAACKRFHATLSSLPLGVTVRTLGSAALDLAYVAAGRMDAFFEENLALWDIAAGIVLVREAGGLVSDFGGGQHYGKGQGIVAGNPYLHPLLLRHITQDSAENS